MTGLPSGPRSGTWIADLAWARAPQQARSQRTQAALLDAVEAALDASSVDELSVADIAQRAGMSVGSLYHHFTNKQAMVYAMLDRFHDELAATIDDATEPQRWVGAGLLDVVQGFVEFSLLTDRGTPGLSRARVQLALADPAVAVRESESWQHLLGRIEPLLWARRSEIGRHDPRASIKFVLDQVTAALFQRSVALTARFDRSSDADFVDTLLESIAAFLKLNTHTGQAGT